MPFDLGTLCSARFSTHRVPIQKVRRAVALLDEVLSHGAPIIAAGITGTLPPCHENYVELPWSRPRHPRLGLNKRARRYVFMVSGDRSRFD